MGFDYESFLAGVQVGRRIKVAAAMRKATPIKPVLAGVFILAEDGTPIIAEAGSYLITEEEVSLSDG